MIQYCKRWTLEEKAYLATHAGKLPNRYLAKVLKRSERAVSCQVSLLKKATAAL